MPSHDTIFHFIFLLPFKEWFNELITFQILQLTLGFRRWSNGLILVKKGTGSIQMKNCIMAYTYRHKPH